MPLSTLGRRYERLLFLAAPLSLASLLILFVVLATNSQKERNAAHCYENAAELLDSKADELEAAWKELNTAEKRTITQISYIYKVRSLLIDVKLGSNCYMPLLDEVETRAKNGPKALILGLREDSKRLFATPIKYPGVEIPEKATIGLMGTSISIELVLFAGLLQIAMAPLLLLWLGSLYNTRFRETLLIEKSKTISEIFPHLINVYPVIRYPEPRRRSYIQPYLPDIFATLYALWRIALLLIFIGPPVAAYSVSVILLESTNSYMPIFKFLGVSTVIFAFALLLCELFPWHARKTFPGPLLTLRRRE